MLRQRSGFQQIPLADDKLLASLGAVLPKAFILNLAVGFSI